MADMVALEGCAGAMGLEEVEFDCEAKVWPVGVVGGWVLAGVKGYLRWMLGIP